MAVAQLPEVDHVSQERRAPSFARRVFYTALRFIAVLLLGAVCAGSWYLGKKGFGRTTRQRVVTELHKHGVEASIRRLTLDPFRGLVARDVRIFDYHDRNYTIAEISRVALDVNYAKLWQGKEFLNALDVRNARVTLPLPKNAPPNAVHPQVTTLNAHIYFPPEQIYVSQAEGTFGGVRISATGQLIRRADHQPSKELTEEERQRRLELLLRVHSELSIIRASSPPKLQVKFSGDLAQLENAHVEASLRADRLQRGNYEARQLIIAGDFSGQSLTISQCEWNDRLGRLTASGVWRREPGTVEFRAQGNLDVRILLESFGADRFLHDFEFPAAPRIDVQGSAHFSPTTTLTWQALGHVQADRFSYRGVPFLSGSAEFSSDGTRSIVRDLRVQHASGQLTGRVFDAPGDFRLDFASSIDANALRGFAPADMREFVSEWEWPHAPVLQVSIRGPGRNPETWSGDGKLQVDRGRFRKIAFNSASSDFHFNDGAVTYENLHVVRDEGVASGTFVYDFKHHETRLTNVRSTLRPIDAIFWVDPTMYKAVLPYKFHKPPTVVVNGVYQFHGGKNTRLEVNVDAPSGVDYFFLGKTLNFNRISAKLIFTDDRLQIAQLDSTIFGGSAHASADISLARNDKHYQAKAAVEHINFPAFTDLYFKYKSANGQLDGNMEWTGTSDVARTMVGSGKVVLRNGDVLAIPVFGPLSDLLHAIFAGKAGYSVARDASATFTMRNGVIHTNDMKISGKIFSLRGDGDIHFGDDRLDLNVRVAPEGPASLLSPIYKIFEYKGEGSLGKPNWHAKNF